MLFTLLAAVHNQQQESSAASSFSPALLAIPHCFQTENAAKHQRKKVIFVQKVMVFFSGQLTDGCYIIVVIDICTIVLNCNFKESVKFFLYCFELYSNINKLNAANVMHVVLQ